MAQHGQLSFVPERIGGWWDRDTEIDVLAISRSEKTVLVGECKWSTNPIGTNILEDLKQKAQVLLQSGEPAQTVQYALFARSGFTPDLKKQARAEGVHLYTVEQIVTAPHS